MLPESLVTPMHPLEALAHSAAGGRRMGITSVCSAHPLVIEAALRHAHEQGTVALIEATCNQVNQDGGYTGMTPAQFRDTVLELSGKVGIQPDRFLLGGDHLGPNPWKHLSADEAMRRSEIMVAAYVEAGFAKIHLDTSMGCRGEPAALPTGTTAERAARLARVAEDAAVRSGVLPYYVIGTEVPTPGGAHEAIDTLAVTQPEKAIGDYEAHRAAFAAAGIGQAFARVVGLVVQPGVEFGSENVVTYEPERAKGLSAALKSMPGLVFEAHSTDYQPADSLARLVQDGFAILKIGPALTFALREALYGLDAVNRFLHPGSASLIAEMEKLMVERPENWSAYYAGSATEQRLQRHFSYSDRIRYYWAQPQAQLAVGALLADLDGVTLGETLISQYLPRLYERARSGALGGGPRTLIIESVREVLGRHFAACG